MITMAFLLLFKSLFPPKWQCIPSQSQAESLRTQKGMKQCLEQKIVLLPTLSSLPREYKLHESKEHVSLFIYTVLVMQLVLNK